MDAGTRAAVLRTLERFSEANRTLDVEAALQVFSSDGTVLLVGSEPNEMARGSEEMRAFFERVLARTRGVHWVWDRIDMSWAGTAVWVFAEGTLHAGTDPDLTGLPYRASIVLEQENGEWRWRLFHGSEPTAPHKATS